MAMQLLQHAKRIGNGQQRRHRRAAQCELGAGVATQLARDAVGMKRAESLPEIQQLLVVDGEERSFQRGEHRQLIVGPFDGGERGADGFDFFPPVKRLAADQQVWNPAGLDRLEIRPRHVAIEADEAPEQYGDVLRLDRDGALVPIRQPLADRPAAAVQEPVDERADGIGERVFDRPGGDAVAVAAST